MADFHLARLTAAQVPAMVDLQLSVFSDAEIQASFTGPATAANRAARTAAITSELGTRANNVWVAVVESSSGRLAAAGNVSVHASAVAEPEFDLALPWLDGEPERQARVRAGLRAKVELWRTLYDEPYMRESGAGVQADDEARKSS